MQKSKTLVNHSSITAEEYQVRMRQQDLEDPANRQEVVRRGTSAGLQYRKSFKKGKEAIQIIQMLALPPSSPSPRAVKGLFCPQRVMSARPIENSRRAL